MAHRLRKQGSDCGVVALVARFGGSSATGSKTRLEPVPVTHGLHTYVLGAFHAFLFVVHRVELVRGIGVGTHNVQNKLSEVTAFVVFLVEHTNERLQNCKRVVGLLGNVEGKHETIALFHAEHETVFLHATRVLANVGRVNEVGIENTTLVESLLFK
uniref:Uncharacterized protein n=1 Tax=Pithovirus LCPAC304 TaxID=2506594 RepID=A0A481Z7L3_9VIRU|nr:MAG: hypothetical protein LCPAC304_02170 [Pithovirus LCPAC304]